MTGPVVLFVIVVLLALLARRWPMGGPPASYTCRSGARVEGDLDLPVADCEHQSPDLCVSWDYPMITVDGAEYQIAGWCRECGALRVFASDDLDEERWLLPRKGASRG